MQSDIISDLDIRTRIGREITYDIDFRLETSITNIS
jgi:hypothetical protein